MTTAFRTTSIYFGDENAQVDFEVTDHDGDDHSFVEAVARPFKDANEVVDRAQRMLEERLRKLSDVAKVLATPLRV